MISTWFGLGWRSGIRFIFIQQGFSAYGHCDFRWNFQFFLVLLMVFCVIGAPYAIKNWKLWIYSCTIMVPLSTIMSNLKQIQHNKNIDLTIFFIFWSCNLSFLATFCPHVTSQTPTLPFSTGSPSELVIWIRCTWLISLAWYIAKRYRTGAVSRVVHS